MPQKRRNVFVTPFSSQKTTEGVTDGDISNPEKKQGTRHTPAGTFLFPVSSTKVDKIQHVTPMTKNKIRQGLSRVIDTYPRGVGQESPAWTFLAISQATSVGDPAEEIVEPAEQEAPELAEAEQDVAELEAGDPNVDVTEDENVYDYDASIPDEMSDSADKNVPAKRRVSKKLVTESIKQEVLKTIYKMHQEIIEIQERRKKLALEMGIEVARPVKKQKVNRNAPKELNNTLIEGQFEVLVNKVQNTHASTEE